MFFSPFSIAITSLGEERANLSAFRTFDRFVLVWICRFPLPLGVWEGLRFFLPGLFSYLCFGIVPDDWKSVLVAPVYKKGPKSKPSNYRPSSFTCIASKLMQHILVSNIMKHFDSNDLLSPFQQSFRSKHSCETQLVSFTQEIFDNLEDSKQTDLIVIYFSKTFDKVDHNQFIYKLFNYGIDLKTVSWIKGSVLASCLFLAYINDLPDSLKSRLLTADTIVYLTITSSYDPETLPNDLHQLEQWESNGSVEFNPDK